MKKNNTLFIFAAGLILLAGCAKEPGLVEAGSITVEATVGQMTKVQYSTDGKSTSFTAGDKIAVFGWTGKADEVPADRVVNGVVNTLGTDGKWTPESQMLWKNVKDEHYFLGVFPAHTITDFTADPYTLDPSKYTESDLLIATSLNGVKASANPVELTFDHAMAKLVVNLKFRSQWDATPTVSSVTALAKTKATVNYLTKTVTATDDSPVEVALAAESSASAGYALTYSGLQVPQDGVRKVSVTIDGKDYVYESAMDIPLTAGQYTTMGLIVGKDKIELSSISVADWAAGASITGGEAVLKGHEYVDMGGGCLLWATCNVGADNPWDYGEYFAWGETSSKADYNWGTYLWMEDNQSSWERITKYTIADNLKDGTKWYDGDTFIGDGYTSFADDNYADDAARANWGGNWRIPTDADWTWLRTNCTWEWTGDFLGDGSNKAGIIMTSKINGNQIFLPAAGYRSSAGLNNEGSDGYYWSSSLYKISSSARGVYFDSGGVHRGFNYRYMGRSVRPVQFREHEYVDLGLPSGLKWATCNVGATKPEEFGDYYAWGETETYYSSLDPLTWKVGMEDGYAWSNYQFGTSDEGPFSKYNATDKLTTLETGPNGDDVASKVLGGSWRMPTHDEWWELMNYCTWEWKTTADGYDCNGYLVFGNGNSIFLPAAGQFQGDQFSGSGSAGRYWTSSMTEVSMYRNADQAKIALDETAIVLANRCYGLSIRAVTE